MSGPALGRMQDDDHDDESLELPIVKVKRNILRSHTIGNSNPRFSVSSHFWVGSQAHRQTYFPELLSTEMLYVTGGGGAFIIAFCCVDSLSFLDINPLTLGKGETSLPHHQAIFSKLKNEDKDLFSFRNCKK